MSEEYERFKEGLAGLAPEGKGAFVAGQLRETADAAILGHACAVAQTRFRDGDTEGFLAIVDAFLEAHPRARPPESALTYLEILGRYPYRGRIAEHDFSLRYATWLRDRILAGHHPALIESLRQFLLAIASSRETVLECLRLVQEGRYPEEFRDRVREVHREATIASFPYLAEPELREKTAKQALLWHPEERRLRGLLVAALVEQGNHEEASTLGTGWLRGAEGDLALLRWTIAALAGAGHTPEAIALFQRVGPAVTGDPEFGLLLFEVVGHYATLGREGDALDELEPFFEPPRGLDVTVLVAALHARRGNVERALHFARLAVQKWQGYARPRFRTPEFATLADNAEFVALVQSRPGDAEA